MPGEEGKLLSPENEVLDVPVQPAFCCQICYEELETDAVGLGERGRIPVTLPCGHTMCAVCSERLRALGSFRCRRGNFKCPWGCSLPADRCPTATGSPFPPARALVSMILEAKRIAQGLNQQMRNQVEQFNQMLDDMRASRVQAWNPDSTTLQMSPGAQDESLSRLPSSLKLNVFGACPTTAKEVTSLVFQDVQCWLPRDMAHVLGQLLGLRGLCLGCKVLTAADAEPLANSMAHLLGLTYLRLDFVGAKAAAVLASAIRELRALEVLSVENAGLADEGACALGEALMGHRLMELHLYNNHMGVLGMRKLACGLGRSGGMRFLNLSRNRLGAAGAAELAKLLCMLTALTCLALDDNGVGAEGAAALSPALQGLQCLKWLRLDRNSIGPRGAQRLAAVLPALALLTRLDMDGNALTGQGQWALRSALQGLSHMQEVWMRDMDSETESETQPQDDSLELPMSELPTTLVERAQTASYASTPADLSSPQRHVSACGLLDNMAQSHGQGLRLHSLQLGWMSDTSGRVSSGAGDLPCTRVTGLLSWNVVRPRMQSPMLRFPPIQGLTTLERLSYTGLGDADSSLVNGLLQRLSRLTHVDLVNAQVGAAGMKGLARGLAHSVDLKLLGLDRNCLGDEGAAELALLLPSLTALTYLSLARNGFGTEGAAALAPALPGLRLLQFLSVKENLLGSRGAEILMEPLLSMSMLTELDFNENALTICGALALRCDLQDLPQLKALWIMGINSALQAWDHEATALQLTPSHDQPGASLTQLPPSLEVEFQEVYPSSVQDVTSLAFQKAGGWLPADVACVLGQLLNVQELSLGGSRLGTVGGTMVVWPLAQLMGLTQLDLRDVGADTIVALAPGIQQLPGLLSLDLACNNLGGCDAHVVGAALHGLDQLSSLHLQHNQLGACGMEPLSLCLVNSVGLRHLELSTNDLGPDGAQLLSGLLEALVGLTCLGLANNRLEANGAAALAPALPELQQLQVLNLSGNGLGEQGARALVEGLTSLSVLSSLDLTDNALRIHVALTLRCCLQCLPRLKELQVLDSSLQSPALNPHATTLMMEPGGPGVPITQLPNWLVANKSSASRPSVVQEITSLEFRETESWRPCDMVHVLSQLPGLRSLHFGWKKLGSAGQAAVDVVPSPREPLALWGKFQMTASAAIMSQVQRLTALEQLNLSFTRFGDEGACLCGEALQGLSRLRGVDLSTNSVGYEGMKGVGRGLVHSTGMKALRLSGNVLGDKGAGELARLLPSLTALTYLALSDNGVGVEGAAALAPALRRLHRLQTLNIKQNSLGPQGAQHVVDALTAVLTLTSLDLNDNELTIQSALTLRSALRRLPLLKQLWMMGTNLSQAWLPGSTALQLKVGGPKVPLDRMPSFLRIRFQDTWRKTVERVTALVFREVDAWLPSDMAHVLSQVPRIQDLSLRSSKLGTAGGTVVVWRLAQLTELTRLEVSDVGAETAVALAPGVQELHALASLGIAYNGLGNEGACVVGEALQGLRQLTGVYLGSNRVGSEGMKGLARGLVHSTGMAVLGLNGNNLGDEGAVELATLLHALTALTYLALSSNGIGAAGTAALAPSLQQLRQLKILNLEQNELGPVGAQHLVRVLPSMAALTSLDLNHNALTIQAALQLRSAVISLPLLNGLWMMGINSASQAWNPDATTLQLKAVGPKVSLAELPPSLEVKMLFGLPQTVNDVTALAFRDAHTWLPADMAHVLGQVLRVQELSLRGSKLGMAGGTAVVWPLAQLTGLTRLGISDVGADTIVALAPGIQELHALVGLGLAYNDLSDTHAGVVGEALQGLEQLTTLYLHGNQLGAEGIKLLSCGLLRAVGMRRLELSNNRIASEGAEPLADVLQSLTALTFLGLASNGLGPDGAAALAPALQTLRQLQFLNLNNNRLGESGAEHLARGLTGLSALTFLDLNNNALGTDAARSLRSVLRCLPHLRELWMTDVGSETQAWNPYKTVLQLKASGAEVSLAQLPKSLEVRFQGGRPSTLKGVSSLAFRELHAWAPNDAAHVMSQVLCVQQLHLGKPRLVLSNGQEWGTVLAQPLMHLTTLTWLSMWSVGADMVLPLAPVIKKLCSLRVLDLRSNGLGDAGACAMADACAGLCQLTTLFFGGNCVGVEGARGLARGLAKCTALRALHLNDNSLGDTGAAELQVLLRAATLLTLLALSNNGIAVEHAAAIAPARFSSRGLAFMQDTM